MSRNFFINGFMTFGPPNGGGGGGNVNYATTLYFVDDFLSFAGGSAASSSPGNWICALSGAAASIDYSGGTSDGLHPGVAQYSTGTDAAGEARHWLSPSSALNPDGIRLNASETLSYDCSLALPTLPDGTNTYVATVGLSNRQDLSNNHCVAQAIWNGSAVRWRLSTSAAGSVTNTDAATGPSANTYYTVSLRALTGSVVLYVDGVQVATHATNIPTGGMTLLNRIAKTAGTTSRQLNVDIVQVQRTLGTRLTLPA